MDNRQYSDLLNAILDLRNATELGFNHMNHRFEGVDARFDRLERRFGALETRVDDGFRDVAASLDDIRTRLTAVEQR